MRSFGFLFNCTVQPNFHIDHTDIRKKMDRYVCYSIMYIRIMVFNFESCKTLPCYTINNFHTIGTLSVSSCFFIQSV